MTASCRSEGKTEAEGALSYTIPLPPVTKKNSQRILVNCSTGRPFVAPSEAYKRYERAAAYFLTPRPCRPIAGPVNVRTVFYMHTRRRCDLVNLQEAVLDVLVKAKVLSDDNSNVVASMDGSRVLYDKGWPRTEIEITEYKEG